MKLKRYIIGGMVAAGIVLAFVAAAFGLKKVNIGVSGATKQDAPKVSAIAGLPCDNASRRPFAVMIESDVEARPLSGISQADAVVEMPVTPNGMTRMMGVFQCQTPKEIGAIRSARADFIPLAAGFQTVYAHFGGEHGALEKLESHIMDNINGLLFDGTIFFRKSEIPRPHNAFTTIDLLTKQAKNYNYDLAKNFSGYPHTDTGPARTLSNVANVITMNYPAPWNVVWKYDTASNTYLRNRGGTTEVDKNTGKQAAATVVAVMHTSSSVINKDYITVQTTGQGSVDIYQNGTVTSGTWKKDPSKLDSKLFFYDAQGKEIKFLPGNIWIEITN
jgi:hypothetical protein